MEWVAIMFWDILFGFSFCGAGDQVQDLTDVRQAFYNRATSPSPRDITFEDVCETPRNQIKILDF